MADAKDLSRSDTQQEEEIPPRQPDGNISATSRMPLLTTFLSASAVMAKPESPVSLCCAAEAEAQWVTPELAASHHRRGAIRPVAGGPLSSGRRGGWHRSRSLWGRDPP